MNVIGSCKSEGLLLTRWSCIIPAFTIYQWIIFKDNASFLPLLCLEGQELWDVVNARDGFQDLL